MQDTSQSLARAFQFHQGGRLAEAERLYQEILAREPGHAAALHLLGVAQLQQGRLLGAVDLISRALEIVPGESTFLTNLGLAYAALMQWEPAVNSLRQAIAANPRCVDAHYNLGTIEYGQGQLEKAVISFERVLSIDATRADAHYNLGNAWRDLGRFEAAERCYREALRLQPGLALAHNNLGATLQALGRFDEALACQEQALRLDPQLAEAHMSRAVLWLRRGDFAAGWPEFEWRWKCRNVSPFVGPQPRWDGSPLAGRTILIQAEQGLGDTLQFVRYAQLVNERGGRVLLQCQPSLERLLLRCAGVETIVPFGAPLPEFDVYVPLISLPGIFGTTLSTIPVSESYLTADLALVDHWSQELTGVKGFRVGIAWQGNPQYFSDRRRSIALDEFAALASVPSVRLISLQKHAGAERSAMKDELSLVELGPNFDEAAGPFVDTAAAMKNLDLVIAPDTVVAHLAGALGVPVWVALSHAPDWRWLIDRDDSPWYPTMRLFRQPAPGNWSHVMQRMAAALASQAVK